MHLYRIRVTETIPKHHSICPPSASITSWRRLETALHESRMNFWGILAHVILPQFDLWAFKLWMWTVETLLSRYDQIPKSRGFRSGEYGAHSSLVMKCGTLTRDGFGSTLVPRATMHQEGCHLGSSVGSISPLDQQIKGDFFRTLLRLPRPSLKLDIAS